MNCPPEYAKAQFKATRELWGKNDGIQAHHVIQSFKPGEVTPEQANEIGQELAKEIAEGYEAVVYTHTDKEHIHNHIVINSVNFETGKKYHAHGKEELFNIREASDRLCRERGLHVVEPNPEKAVHLSMKQYKPLKEGESRQARLINAIRHAKSVATNKTEYIHEMNRLGYDVNWSEKRTRITYIDTEYQRLNEERQAAGKKGVKYRFSERSLQRYGITKEELSKEGLENDFREHDRTKQTERTTGSNQERGSIALSNEQSSGLGRTERVAETNENKLGFNEYLFGAARASQANRGEDEHTSIRAKPREQVFFDSSRGIEEGSRVERESNKESEWIYSEFGSQIERFEGTNERESRRIAGKSDQTIPTNDRRFETTIGEIEQRTSTTSGKDKITSSRANRFHDEVQTGEQTHVERDTHGERIKDRSSSTLNINSMGTSDTSHAVNDLFQALQSQQNKEMDRDLEKRRQKAKKKSKNRRLDDELEL
ncbi:MAG TPA: relaxase/mobilization nuclease domain-containing protein [Flavobacterium sp.]|nr:relaxase/mobilization nuclease domain-containing protein [Flavobacterium sp.]